MGAFGNHQGQMVEYMLDVLTQGGGLNQFTAGQYGELYKALRANRQSVANGQLLKALAKSGVGYPTQAQAATSASGSELAPLVPQSLDPRLVSATFAKRHVRFYNMLAKPSIFNTVHEAVRLDQAGLADDVPGWFSEGGAPPVFEETFSRLVQQVKYFGRKFKLTDVARMTGIAGFQGLIKRDTLRLKTDLALLGISGQIERELYWADSALSSLSIDGLYKQTVGNGVSASSWYNAGLPFRAPDGDNYLDNRGAVLDHTTLIRKSHAMAADPIFGNPNIAFVGPKAYGRFREQALAYSREKLGGGDLTFGPTGGVQFAGPYGPIAIEPIPFMPHVQTPRSTASASTAPDISGLTVTGSSPTGSASTQFAAADAGDYIYQLVPVGDGGKGAAKSVTATGVVAGDKVQIDAQDAAKQGSGDGNVRYYEVYRSDKNGAASTAQFLWRYPINDDGTASGTRIVDENAHLPGTSPCYLMEFSPDVMYMPTLLPITRRPLPSENTTSVALLMTFFSLFVRMPSRVFVIDNCLEG